LSNARLRSAAVIPEWRAPPALVDQRATVIPK